MDNTAETRLLLCPPKHQPHLSRKGGGQPIPHLWRHRIWLYVTELIFCVHQSSGEEEIDTHNKREGDQRLQVMTWQLMSLIISTAVQNKIAPSIRNQTYGKGNKGINKRSMVRTMNTCSHSLVTPPPYNIKAWSIPVQWSYLQHLITFIFGLRLLVLR